MQGPGRQALQGPGHKIIPGFSHGQGDPGGVQKEGCYLHRSNYLLFANDPYVFGSGICLWFDIHSIAYTDTYYKYHVIFRALT